MATLFNFRDMANTKSAAKRARQTIKRTARNRTVLTALKGKAKAAKGAAGDQKAEQTLISELDKAVKRGVIHKNAANRRKSRLAKKAATAAKAA